MDERNLRGLGWTVMKVCSASHKSVYTINWQLPFVGCIFFCFVVLSGIEIDFLFFSFVASNSSITAADCQTTAFGWTSFPSGTEDRRKRQTVYHRMWSGRRTRPKVRHTFILYIDVTLNSKRVYFLPTSLVNWIVPLATADGSLD